MFSNSNKMANNGRNKESELNNSVNLISKETEITGEITTQSDLRVDGTLEGTIKSGAKVVIGESGRVTGKVFCMNADISGKLKGSIFSDELLHLKEKGSVNGDMHTSKLIIESGAVFTGNCEMGEKMVEKNQKNEKNRQQSIKTGVQKNGRAEQKTKSQIAE